MSKAVEMEVAQALIEVQDDPGYKEDTVELIRQASEISLKYKKIKINSDEEAEVANDALIQVGDIIKKLDEDRKARGAFHYEMKRAIDGLYSPALASLKSAKEFLNSLMTKWRAKKRIQEQKDNERREKEARKLEEKLKKAGIDEKVVLSEPIQSKMVTSSLGTSYEVKAMKWECIDKMALVKAVAKGQIGINCIEISKTHMDTLVKSGITNIPGIRIWEHTDIRSRKR